MKYSPQVWAPLRTWMIDKVTSESSIIWEFPRRAVKCSPGDRAQCGVPSIRTWWIEVGGVLRTDALKALRNIFSPSD